MIVHDPTLLHHEGPGHGEFLGEEEKWIDCDWPEERTELFEEVHIEDGPVEELANNQEEEEDEDDHERVRRPGDHERDHPHDQEDDSNQLMLLDQLVTSGGCAANGTSIAVDFNHLKDLDTLDHLGTEHSTVQLLPQLVDCLDLELESNHSGPKSNEELLSDQQPTPCPEPVEPVSLVCKWLNCDWPGTYDDLVDHIREIHVELQPYHHPPPSTSDDDDEDDEIINSCPPSAIVSASSSSFFDPPLPSSTSSCSHVPTDLAMASSHPFNLVKCRRTVSSESAMSSLTSASSSTMSTPTSFGHRDHHSGHGQSRRHDHHLQQEPNTKYVCLWRGCKVFKKPSQSRSWLERHVLLHSGDKPFKCIVAGCGQRFKGQTALEKHVNGHFNSMATKDNHNSLDQSNEHYGSLLDFDNGPTMMRAKCPGQGLQGQPGTSSTGGTPSKSSALKRKKGNQARVRKRTLVKGCSEDFFDALTMEQIQFKLFQVNELTGLDVDGRQMVTFKATVSMLV